MKAKFRSNKNKFDCNLKSVADPDLQIRGGGRGGGHPDPEIRGVGAVSKKNFSALRASFWSKKAEDSLNTFLNVLHIDR